MFSVLFCVFKQQKKYFKQKIFKNFFLLLKQAKNILYEYLNLSP